MAAKPPLFLLSKTERQADHAIPVSPFRINTCKSVSKQMTLSPFRMNTGSVDILPDEGMPQAIEVVGKTEQQGLANLYR